MANHNPPTNGFDKRREDINLEGAPKKPWTWSGLLREALEEKDENGVEYKVHVSKSLRLKAIEGDVAAIKEFGNRIDGMPQQAIDLTTKGKPLLNFDLYGNSKSIQSDEAPAETDGSNEDSPRPEV